ncbi:MAG: hypothetical protein HYY13_13225 [Nitrospirae bacterium]|nr:hypothetical protein [Nitrospirota bacterium]
MAVRFSGWLMGGRFGVEPVGGELPLSALWPGYLSLSGPTVGWKILAGFSAALVFLMVFLMQRRLAYFRSIQRAFRATRRWRFFHQQVLFRGEYEGRPVALLLQWGGGFRTRLHVFRPFGSSFPFEYPPEYRRGFWGRDEEVDYVVLRDEAGREIRGVKVHQPAARKRGDSLSRPSARILQPLRDRNLELTLHEGYLVLTHRSLHGRWKPADIGEAIEAARAVTEAIGWSKSHALSQGVTPTDEEIAGRLLPESAAGSFRTEPFARVDRWATFRRAWRRHVPLVTVTAILFAGIGYLSRERSDRVGWTATASVEVPQSGGMDAGLYSEVQGSTKESARSFASGILRESVKALVPEGENPEERVWDSFASPLNVRGYFKLYAFLGLGVGFLLALWLEGLRRLAGGLPRIRSAAVEESDGRRTRAREVGDMLWIVWKRQWVVWLTAMLFAALDWYASERMDRVGKAAGRGWLAALEMERGEGANVWGDQGIWGIRLEAVAASQEECGRLMAVMIEKAREKAPKWTSWDEARAEVEPAVLPWSPHNTWPVLVAGVAVGLGLLLAVEWQAQRRRRGPESGMASPAVR